MRDTKGFPCPQFIFTLEKCFISMGMEKEGDDLFQTIKELRAENPHWLKDFEKVTLWVIKKTAGEDPIETGFSWKLDQKAREEWCSLRDRLHSGSYKRGIFWAYNIINQLQPADGSDEIHVELPWLKGANGEYAKWNPSEPYFCSETERKSRLIEGSRIERTIQHRVITTLFSTANRHKFWIERLPESKHCFVHVKVQNTSDEEHVPVPEIRPPTKARFTFVENQSIAEIDRSDLNSSLVGHYIVVVIKPDLETADRQIRALREAGNIRVYGDAEPEQEYSLQKTIMAYGVELNPNWADYFELSVNQTYNLQSSLQGEHLAYILQKCPFNSTQRKAFNRSTGHICAEMYIIKARLELE
ncbi:hypothetical protein DTO164E3_5628 [Paecilomyces variotii]|nr:hypothetical protein DTO164E3_5628 [Paecilomyces variotii]KAJ9198232.1 hypothetical protein DTO032I3_5648 [Paecilomyces variotii]KAJ9274878.1 hypothetical protein DTO021D3_8236 [Paecilomyces variotii]KAJ9344682.1 hypothetical protein DTO027B6_2864 [Paecilomyces variotii]KAJ9347664.1 hypothetical protein DTO027B9_8996 [Paecilomyces variotii]